MRTGANYSYAIKAVNEFGSLGEASDAVSGIYSGFAKNSILNPAISVNNKELRVSNIVSGVKVNLYSVDGKMISNDISVSNEFSKTYSQLNGIYIFKTEQRIV